MLARFQYGFGPLYKSGKRSQLSAIRRSGLVRDRRIARHLDRIPGVISALTFAVCAILAVVAPRAAITAAAIVASYAAVRFVAAAVANVMGLNAIRRAVSTNWRDVYDATRTRDALEWDDVRHLVIIPNVDESEGILRQSLEHLARADGARTSIIVALAMEGREAGSVEKANALIAEFGSAFADIFFTVHPADLPGEMSCKSANLAWAARTARKRLIYQGGLDPEHIMVTAMDADTLWHPRYFAALTCNFALSDRRYDLFWQAPVRFHSNIYDVNPVIRLVNVYATAFELAYLSARWWQSLPMSSYSLSWRLLESSGFHDPDVIADEWRMYIKAFFSRELRPWVEPIYLPFLAMSATGESFWSVCKNRYHQSVRHAWGTKEIGYTLGQMGSQGAWSARKAWRLLFSVSHDILLSGAGWIIVTICAYVPMVLYPDYLGQYLTSAWEFPPFVVLQVAFTVMGALGVVFWAIDVRQRPPRPRALARGERALSVISFVLLPLLALVFVTIPVLHAQLWLLIGRPLSFRVTAKV